MYHNILVPIDGSDTASRGLPTPLPILWSPQAPAGDAEGGFLCRGGS